MREGIHIDAVTIQNEPLHPGNNPSLFMPAPEQARFVVAHLGPAFRIAGVKTKIIIYDHNADRPDYPISILNDPDARKFIDGSAFHLYKGEISALSKVHEAHPDKNLYFTEQWIGAPGNLKGDLAWHTKHLVVGASRNWARGERSSGSWEKPGGRPPSGPWRSTRPIRWDTCPAPGTGCARIWTGMERPGTSTVRWPSIRRTSGS